MNALPTAHARPLLRCAFLAALAVAALAAPLAMWPSPAQAAPPEEGVLSKHINLDADDTATKLDILIHTLYAQEQRIIALQFRMEYGERVDMKLAYFPTDDNSLIPGYVFTPKAMQAGKRHPAIVLVHGGFHERFNTEWFRFIDEAVAQGYVLIFPEYRGSRGYGDKHFKNEYGNTDVADVLAASDYFARKDFVDPARMGIYGTSRGGMVTLLAIQKRPTLFQAAIDVVGLTDFVAYMGYKPEYRRREVANSATFGGKLPHENLPAYMAASPINNVDAIQTPLLVLATTGDQIAPVALHTGRLLDALKARGKVFEAHIYDNAPGGHVLAHGDTEEQRDAHRRMFDFLARYLKP